MTDEPTRNPSQEPTPPPGRGSGPGVLLVGALAFGLVLLIGGAAMFALGVGPFARATARPTATLVAQPTPTIGRGTAQPSGSVATPVATPAPSPTGSVPSATPIGDPKEALLSHIPAAIADTCLVSAPDDPGKIRAIAVCDAAGGDIRVTYFQYLDRDSMVNAYSSFRIASQIEPDSGDCDDPATWPTENSYSIGDVTAGRLLCTDELGETSLYWTDDRLNILSQATHREDDHARLISFWTSESGPNL